MNLKQSLKKTSLITGLLASTLISTPTFSGTESPCISFCNPCYCSWGWNETLCPSLGVDYKYGYLMGKKDWATQFARYYPMANFYLSARIHKYFGIELGYESSATREKINTFTATERFFENNLAGFSYRQTLKMSMPHADFNFYLCLFPQLDLLASMGVGQLNVNVYPTVLANATGGTPPVGNALAQMRFRRAVIFRARLGLQYYITHNFGLRALAGVDMTTRVYLERGGAENTLRNLGIPIHVFKDMASASLGLFVSWH